MFKRIIQPMVRLSMQSRDETRYLHIFSSLKVFDSFSVAVMMTKTKIIQISNSEIWYNKSNVIRPYIQLLTSAQHINDDFSTEIYGHLKMQTLFPDLGWISKEIRVQSKLWSHFFEFPNKERRRKKHEKFKSITNKIILCSFSNSQLISGREFMATVFVCSKYWIHHSIEMIW